MTPPSVCFDVARDYRIPAPLDLDDGRAGRLAERLVRFIMSELGTPVSVGLHRDAGTRDSALAKLYAYALGNRYAAAVAALRGRGVSMPSNTDDVVALMEGGGRGGAA